MKARTACCVVAVLIAALAPAVSGDEARPTCAVLPFEAGAGLSAEEAAFLHARFATLLPKFDRYDVVAESRIQDLLAMAEFNRSDFTSTMDYALEIGKILQIRYVIIGTAGRIGDLFSLNTSVVDIETGKIIDTAVSDHKGAITDFAASVPEQNIRELLYGSAIPRGPDSGKQEAAQGADGTPEKAPALIPSHSADRRAGLQQARSLYDAGLYKECIDAVKKLIRESGPSVDAHILLGEAYARQKGWYNLAVRELEKALALDATSVDARMALARVHLEVGRRADRAGPLLEQVQAIAPATPGLEELLRAAQ